MSDASPGHERLLSLIGRAFFVLLLAFLLLVVLVNVGLEGVAGAILEVAWHLLTGAVAFLAGNLGKLSTDAGTWGPGLAAFVAATVVAHRFLRGIAARRHRTWSCSATASIVMFLPLLFATAFLVPGVLLQVRGLFAERWFESGLRYPPEAAAARQLSMYANAWAGEFGDGRFPPSVAAMVESGLMSVETGRFVTKPALLGEPALYLGAGLTMDSDASLPLVISSPYEGENGLVRLVVMVGSDRLEIREDELNGWVDRALAARQPRTTPPSTPGP